MNEDFPFDENELTTEDLAILSAFDAIENWPTETGETTRKDPGSASGEHYVEDDLDGDAEMLMIFLEEAGEDIAKMQQACKQLTQGSQLSSVRFNVFQRAGHKLRGTAGAVGYLIMSTVAEQIEAIAEQVQNHDIKPAVGLKAIMQAIAVLESCHSYLAEEGQEPDDPELLLSLTATYQSLGITITTVMSPTTSPLSQQDEISRKATIPLELTSAFKATLEQAEDYTDLLATSDGQISNAYPLFIHIETRRFEKLLHHTGQLIEMHAALESAQRDVKAALLAQQAAQTQLQQLEQSLTNRLREKPSPQIQEELTSSSLIARILSDAQQENPRSRRQHRSRQQMQPLRAEGRWDELDMEHYSEQDLLLQSLREAVNRLAVCSARVATANTALQIIQQEYMARATVVRGDTQMMRLTPLSTLVPRLQRVIAMSALAQQYKVDFEVTGDTLEIDQEILESLSPPLLHMLQTCISDTSVIQEEQAETYHVWLNAHSNGNDITIEIGFSMPVMGGTLEILRAPLQKLNGTINLHRNTAGGVSFHLSIPRSQGTVQCLLIRSGEQQLIAPITQIQRVSIQKLEHPDHCYRLKDLLDMTYSAMPNVVAEGQPVLIIQSPTSTTVGILVDEILSEHDFIVRPLPTYLQRPGITESAINGQGDVLLMLDLPVLVRRYLQQTTPRNGQASEQGDTISGRQMRENRIPKILVADDSAYLRQAVLQTLKRDHYEVAEARDGMEAIEQLLENTPDIFLLDVEMPNLNGYDVLNIIREYPELAHVKTIMLTSRTSEKHMQRARELGAQAYLTKPCPQSTLLSTIRELLGEDTSKHPRMTL
ncbi:ATP-binding response regulator [Dictyobacter kobayashii]|uniref:Histidine kinase n=1 Tax=Dictyobacter kobayashii TaxID=2014872 RepID=A0A402AIM9_9CHLR|nr:hybrid sensor histidine kinase/response regulator [Dictyobacter kobayashii]GCE18910.1 hypothetical protein KDK_27100 [Dictyobacter kobayashii]